MRAALALALVAGFALTGCSRGGKDEARPLDRGAVRRVGEHARRRRSGAVPGRVRAGGRRVAAANGTVVGDVIDENPLAHSTYPIDGTFEACDPLTDNRLVCDARAQNVRTGLVTGAEQILRNPVGARHRHPGRRVAGEAGLRRLPGGLAALARGALGHGRAHAAGERRRGRVRGPSRDRTRSTGWPRRARSRTSPACACTWWVPGWWARPSSRPRGSSRSRSSGSGSSPTRTPS